MQKFICTLSFLLSAGAAAQYLEAVRPVPVEIDTRSPVRFEVRSSIGNKPVKGVVLQVFSIIYIIICAGMHLILRQYFAAHDV